MTRVRFVSAVVVSLLALLTLEAGNAAAAVVYMGPNETVKTLRQAFAEMKGGDTLIIRDGRYTGPDNAITLGQNAPVVPLSVPPNGSPAAYTVIRAEHEGRVTFDGEARICMFGLFLNVEPGTAVPEFAYVEFRGIKWVNPKIADADGQTAAVGIHRVNAHHVKFFRCGAMVGDTDPVYGTSEWAIETGHHLLFEECYAWGNGRYGFKIQDRMSNDPGLNDRWRGATQIVLRRCVVRLDRALASRNPIAAFMSYNAASVEYQNCIAVDLDPASFNAENGLAAFAGRYHLESGYGWTVDNHWRGTIVLKTNNNYTQYLGADGAWANRTSMDGLLAYMVPNENASLSNSLTNAVAWDVPVGVLWASSENRWAGSPVLSNLTVHLQKALGDRSTVLYTYGAFQASTFIDPPPALLKNSLFISADDQLSRNGEPRSVVNIARTDYSSYWTPSPNVADANPYAHTVGAHDYSELTGNAVNPYTGSPGNGIPALRYIVRTEPGSDLYGTGEAGSNRGATVLGRYGVSGTLWGEPGYNTLTSESLWPFPAEDQIRDAFRSYAYPGGPDGKRGFCADGQTLTHYVWGYLGQAVPPLGVTVTRETSSVTLSWEPPAGLALPTIVGFNIYRVDGGQRSLVGMVEGNATYTATVVGLDPDGSYAFAVTTVDAQKGESGLSETAVQREPATNNDPDPGTNGDPDPGTNGDPDPGTNNDPDPGTNGDPDPGTLVAPAITWPPPSPIVEGTPLSGAELTAGTNVPGTFVYTPPAGTVLPAGVHTLSLEFTPEDRSRYSIAAASTTVTVTSAGKTRNPRAPAQKPGRGRAASLPVTTWSAPPPATEGAALRGAELNAGAVVRHASHELTVLRPAGGTVWGAGISCGTRGFDCQEATSSAVWLGLQASPDPGFVFVTWTGDCSGTAPQYALRLKGVRTCSAVFTSGTGSPQ